MELGFCGGSITEEEWNFIKENCQKLNFKSIIEIGSGFSTTKFQEIMNYVESYETNDSFIEKINELVDLNKVKVIKYHYPDFPVINKKFDVGLVDGPGQGNKNGRMDSMMFVKPLTNFIFIHDFSRKAEEQSVSIVFPKNDWKIIKSKSRILFIERINKDFIKNKISTNEINMISQTKSESSIR